MPTEKQQVEIDDLNRKLRRAIKISKKIDAAILIFLLLILLYIFSTIYDDVKLIYRGYNTLKYHNFEELLEINPDTKAWITMDGTRIDHPVVQGTDNFEYLDKDFNGEHFTGGTLFLDSENTDDFSDDYNIIHGHHMSGGAMFGDLTNYTEEEFFNDNKDGTLLTPTYDYKLEVIGVAKVNAYDHRVYSTSADSRSVYDYTRQVSINRRDISLGSDEKILTLSTCSGDMTEDRIVVFCRMYDKIKHE